MDDINSITLVGRLTKDGELKYTNSNSPMAILNLSIAVNRSRKNQGSWEDMASFFEVTVFGKRAESLKPMMAKGKLIAVQGSLRQERWQDKETGKQKSRIYVAAENIELLGSNPNSQQADTQAPGDFYNDYGDYQN